MSDSHTHEHDIKKEVRAYIAVFVALAILTVITVAVSYIPFIMAVAVTIGLLIATIKASLVALFFMHLRMERRLIYWSLVLTLVFLLALFVLPLWAYWDQLFVKS